MGWCREGSRGRWGGNEGCSLVAAHQTDGREVVVDVLGSIGQASEFSELEMEGSEGGVFFKVEGAAAFVKAVLEIGGEVGEELLRQGAGPGRDGSRGGRVEGGRQGEEFAKHLRGRVVGFLFRGVVEAGSSELAELVEDSLGSGFIADDCADVVAFQEVGENSKVARPEDLREEVNEVGGSWGLGGRALRVGVDCGVGSKGGSKLSEGFEEAKVAVVVGKAIVFVEGDTAAHAVRDDDDRGGSWCVRWGFGFGFGLWFGPGQGLVLVIVGSIVVVLFVVVAQ